MKYIVNTPLFGRVEKGEATPITVNTDPMTPGMLVCAVLRVGLPEKMMSHANYVKIGDIIDKLDPQEHQEYIEFGDTDWDFIRPLIERWVLTNFERHEPVIMDELDARINRGKPESFPEEKSNAHQPIEKVPELV